MIQVVACKGIIVRDDKVLLLRESATHITNSQAGKYQFPGGRIEPGEPFADGLAREVREETGLKIEIGKPFYVGEWTPVVKGQQLHIVGIFFLCKDNGGDVVISEEHDDYQWLREDEVNELAIMEPDDEVIAQLFASLRSSK